MNEPMEAGTERDRASRALKALPFVGIVEHYDRSIAIFEELITPYFPEFKAVSVRQNVTQHETTSLESRLERAEAELGPGLCADLLAANADDLEVYAAAERLHRDR